MTHSRTPRRLRARAALAPVLALLLTGSAACGEDGGADDETVTITVVSRDWSGWSEGPAPDPVRKQVEVGEDDTFEVEVLTDPLRVTVAEIAGSRVELELDQAMAPVNEGGGIDLNDDVTALTLTGTAPVEVATPTMDAGTHVTFRIR